MADKWFQEGCLFSELFLMYLDSAIHIPCQYELRAMSGYPRHNYEGRIETASARLLLQLSLPPEGGHHLAVVIKKNLGLSLLKKNYI